MKALVEAKEELKLNFEAALTRLTDLSEELSRYSGELSSKLVVDFLNPFRTLLSEFELKEAQLKLARESFDASFTSSLDSNLYLPRDVAKMLNADPHKQPKQITEVSAKLEEAKSAFTAVREKLIVLSNALDKFLVDVSLENFDLRKISYAISTSERLIKEINDRIAKLREAR